VKQAQQQMDANSPDNTKGDEPEHKEPQPEQRSNFLVGLKALRAQAPYQDVVDKATEEKEEKVSKPDWVNPKPPSYATNTSIMLKNRRNNNNNNGVTLEKHVDDPGNHRHNMPEEKSVGRRLYQTSVRPDDLQTVRTSTTTFSRGRVGRSSVKELSKRFESEPCRLSSEKSTLDEEDKSCNIALTNYAVHTDFKQAATHERSDFRSFSANTAQEREKPTRSFLNTHTPIETMSDFMGRMKGAEEISEDGVESDRSLLNKFIGAHALLQGIEPLLSGKSTEHDSVSLVRQFKSFKIMNVQRAKYH